MLPNMLDGEGRSLVMLAAMQNDEILMHAILGSRHAFQFGLQVRQPIRCFKNTCSGSLLPKRLNILWGGC